MVLGGGLDASRMNQRSNFVLLVDFLSLKLLGFACEDLICTKQVLIVEVLMWVL